MSLTTPTQTPPEAPLTFSEAWAAQLAPYLPPAAHEQEPQPPTVTTAPNTTTTTTTTTTTINIPVRRPFVTLTYAQSLDAHLALGPGLRTALSGPATKAMTHFLRARHAALLVGVGTAHADDPGLNCRLAGAGSSPRPVVLDPRARWAVTPASKVVRLAREGRGAPPWVLHAAGTEVGAARRAVVEGVGGRYVPVPTGGGERAGARLAWAAVLAVLRAEGVASVMVEGGGKVINQLLEGADRGEDVVDAVIVTVAPVWLGAGGVAVAPGRRAEGVPGPRLGAVRWVPMGEDVVLCGRFPR